MLPPRIVRRLVFAPLVVLITVAGDRALAAAAARGGRRVPVPTGPAAGAAAALVRAGLAGDGVAGPGGLPGPVDRQRLRRPAAYRGVDGAPLRSGPMVPGHAVPPGGEGLPAAGGDRGAASHRRGAGGPADPAGHRPQSTRRARRLVPARAPPAQPLPPQAPHRDEGGAAARPEPGRGDQPAAARLRPARPVDAPVAVPRPSEPALREAAFEAALDDRPPGGPCGGTRPERRGGGDPSAGGRARADRCAGHLPRGRQLHAVAVAAGHQPPGAGRAARTRPGGRAAWPTCCRPAPAGSSRPSTPPRPPT